MVGIIGFRFTGTVGPFAAFIEVVFPNQSIGIGKCVLLENEVARSRRRRGRRSAAGEQNARKNNQPAPGATHSARPAKGMGPRPSMLDARPHVRHSRLRQTLSLRYHTDNALRTMATNRARPPP